MKKLQINKRLKNVLSMILLAIAVGQVKAQTINFSGDWKRNDSLSNAGRLSNNSIPVELKIRQDKQTFTMEKTLRNGAGEVFKNTTVLNFDGTPSQMVTSSKLHRSSTIEWSADKNQLLETAISKDDEGAVKQAYKYTYSLENNDHTLKVIAVAALNGENYQLTEIFNKSINSIK